MSKKQKQRYRICNWSEYNGALVRRGSLTVWIEEAALDCWHEEFGLGSIIALSFTEFLAGALASGGEQYWLKPDAPRYGCIFEREGKSA